MAISDKSLLSIFKSLYLPPDRDLFSGTVGGPTTRLGEVLGIYK